MVAIARLTLRRAVEQIAREMTEPMSLDEIIEEACRRTGRQPAKSTPATVRGALDRLEFIIRCGRKTYGPAHLLLDQKALRVKLTPSNRAKTRIGRSQLEPFYSALEEPAVETEDGRPLEPIYLQEEITREIRKAMVSAIRETLQQFSPLGHIISSMRDEEILERAERDLGPMDTGFLDLRPVLDAFPDDEPLDLIVRWHKDRNALIVAARPEGHDDPARVAEEDRLLADYLASRLVEGYAVPVGPLVLEAYARFDQLGRTPGSTVVDVIRSDSRLRITGDDSYGIQQINITHAHRPTYAERRASEQIDLPSERWLAEWRRSLRARIEEHPRRLRKAWEEAERELGLTPDAEPRWSNVRLLRKPTHDQLIEEWEQVVKKQGLSERIQRRKVNHVRDFAFYLESEFRGNPTHLLDVDVTDLEDFFFWTYIRRWANPNSNAAAFALDLRDFYRYQEKMGRIPDARFAELIYRVRGFIQERLELYFSLNPHEEDFEELFERLFLG